MVDNGPDQPAREVVESCGLPATWLPSWHNLGGAGGFALGILHALALGADWVWLADDDGRAADEDVLATLVELAERRGLAAVSPTVVDADDPDRLAFTVRRGLTWHRSRAALAADTAHGADGELLPGIAALFNGALFRASTIDAIGVPDLRLFVRGDEVEMHRRLVRSGLPFGTALRAAYLHPAGLSEDKPMLGGRLHARDPDDDDQALLHLPQPRLPGVAARDAPHRAAGAAPVRLVLPGHPAQPAPSSRSGCGWCARAARSASAGPGS